MKSVILDIETNGLLPELTKLHSLVLRNRHNLTEVLSCTDHSPDHPSIQEGLAVLAQADTIYAHNGIAFDIPAIQKLYPEWTYRGVVMDTLIAARHRFAHQKELDFPLMQNGRLPGKLVGSHSLKAWGLRLGCKKDEYAGGWELWSEEMQSYCEQDTLTTAALIEHISKHGVSPKALETEMALAWYLTKQQENGWPFDWVKATGFYGTLAARREELGQILRDRYGSWTVTLGTYIAKVNNKARGRVKGEPYTKTKIIEFNPTSRDHIANRLMTLHGWKPDVYTDGGKPEVSEDTLKGLDFPGIADLVEYLLIDKRISQLAEGKQAWLKCMKILPSGYGGMSIHGSINQSGAVTHRATHSYPNISQVPAIPKPFWKECRELFMAPPGWVLMGADASGLELRCLAHYMAKYDGGAYGKVILEADIHSENQKALGALVPEGKEGRAKAKTFIYAFLYGAGDNKIGSIISPLESINKQKAIGKKLKATFLQNTPALKYLLRDVEQATKARGYLTVLDGRRAYVRSAHAALNTLLQCAGAVICKHWIVEFDRRMTARFGPQGWDGQWAAVGWIHDEIQVAVRETIAEEACGIAVASIEHITSIFNFRCPLTGEAKTGRDWAATH